VLWSAPHQLTASAKSLNQRSAQQLSLPTSFQQGSTEGDAVVISMRVQTVDRLRLIQQEIDKINERNGVMAVKPPAGG
jgi:hypothetical protein